MTNDEIAFTKAWWTLVCKDEKRFTKWVQKLQVTEIGGFWDHVNYLIANPATDDRVTKILTNIADDEKKHSIILTRLMFDRGIPTAKINDATTSSYWSYMNEQYATVEEYAAINHFGEALAAERFEIIEQHSATPSDVVTAIRSILPDEIFHRETLQRLAGEEALTKMKYHHEQAFNRLLKK